MPQSKNGNGDLLIGGEFCDDAAVWQTGADSAIVASADFFAPVVDDAADFGAIAAANALSDYLRNGCASVVCPCADGDARIGQ